MVAEQSFLAPRAPVETNTVATTAMALRTCSTVKMMLGTVVAQAQKLVPPATRTVQDLKVLANDLADAS